MECKNCQTLLADKADFCHNCGGKVVRNRLTIRNLFDHFTETFLNYDNKFLRTYIDLFKRPDDVIGSYIHGTRKKYVDVISYFALAITVSGLQMYILNNFFPEAFDMSVFKSNGTEEFQRKNMSFVQEYQSLIMMLYVPIYAIISRIVFLNKKTYNYTEQLVIYMYIQAQSSITMAIILTGLIFVGVDFGMLSLMSIPLMIIYTSYCLKKLYKLTFTELVLKILIFAIIFTIVAVLFMIVLFGILYLTGDLQELMEAQKAARQS